VLILLLVLWRGSAVVEGVVHEPGAYHPYVSTATLRLREGAREGVPGGVRVALVSEGSTLAVSTEVRQLQGGLVCSGRGAEAIPDGPMGYVESIGGETSYHLVLHRAFGAFACGENHVVRRDRVVIIGRGDPEAAEIETADSLLRRLAGAGMEGTFRASKTRGSVSYEYEVRWSLKRESP
jgi:hypothetical protein